MWDSGSKRFSSRPTRKAPPQASGIFRKFPAGVLAVRAALKIASRSLWNEFLKPKKWNCVTAHAVNMREKAACGASCNRFRNRFLKFLFHPYKKWLECYNFEQSPLRSIKSGIAILNQMKFVLNRSGRALWIFQVFKRRDHSGPAPGRRFYNFLFFTGHTKL